MVVLCLAVLGVPAAAAQRVAVIAPGGDGDGEFVGAVVDELSAYVRVPDPEMSTTAFRSVEIANPFNMTRDESRLVGGVVGCDAIVLTRGATMRRSSSSRPEYYEAFAPVYVVGTRTGELIYWNLLTFEAADPTEAGRRLLGSVPALVSSIATALREYAGRAAVAIPPMEELPADGSPAAKDFRAPVPYRRIKPVYTEQAAFYDVTATVEIEVDLDSSGTITRTAIVRWAGYGLDEAVTTAVRAMNWRPAERRGKPAAMRFVLRYNFKRTDKDGEKRGV